jgi:hypothetical protein
VDRDHNAWVAAIVQAIEKGEELDLAPGETIDPQQADKWPTSRRLPGEALREALLQSGIEPDPRGLSIRAAYVTGETELFGFHIPHSLWFEDCAFEEPLMWTGLIISGFFGLSGCVTLSVNLDRAEINGPVHLDGLTATGGVQALGAIIEGELFLQDATLIGRGGDALNLSRAKIKDAVFLGGLNATGGVDAFSASIGALLDLHNAILTNEGGNALSLHATEIKGGVALNGLTATGRVQALGATIGGELSLQDAAIISEGEDALSLDGAEIKGPAFFTCLSVTGGVRARWIAIGGVLVLQDAILINEREDALNLDGAKIKGDAFLGNLRATGLVRAVGAVIGGQLNLVGATLINEGGYALLLRSARLGELFLSPASVKGRLGLTAANIDVLIAPEKMDVLTAHELAAVGWRLGDVRGPIRHNRRTAAAWLTTDGSDKDSEFVAQPWHELANVYERNGQPADARWLRFKAAQGVTRTSPWWSKLIRKIYGLLVGHGYYPLIAAVWLIIAIVLSGIIVNTNAAVFTPTAANKAAWKTPPPVDQPAAPITGATPCDELQDRSSCLNPVLYAFDNALPGTLATGQAAQWTANGTQGSNTWIPYTLGALKLFSWILVALLLAGVTGLLRKT